MSGIPDVESPQIMLGGLVKTEPKQPLTSLTSSGAVLEARKMVARYCLLAWAMCYSTISQPLEKSFSPEGKFSTKALIDKGLLRDRELSVLQVNYIRYDINFDRVRMEERKQTDRSATCGGSRWPGL